MRIVGTIPPGSVIGLGVFDGVHLGHQDIVQQSDCVMTLFPHPDRILRKNLEMPYLCSLVELASLLPHLVILRFSSQVAKMTAFEFVEFLMHQFQPKGIVVGSDFRFGLGQSGSVDFLRTWAATRNIEITAVPLKGINGTPIKSSGIRTLIQSGEMAAACELMGHHYPLFGRVIRGKGNGKTLGFPTANLRVFRNKCLPAFGVYAGEVDLEGNRVRAIIYIGNRPTLNTGFSVEVHIPEWSGGLYGKRLKVWVSRRIRGDYRFESVNALVEQINRDIASL